nr:MAG: movement protein [Guangxi phenui-like virus]
MKKLLMGGQKGLVEERSKTVQNKGIFSKRGVKGLLSNKRTREITSGELNVDGMENDALLNRDADRQLYRFEMPTQERGFSDLLDAHNPGERFPHVAIVGDDVESLASRTRRLVQTAPQIKRNVVQLPKRISISLFNQQEQLPLSNLLNKRVKLPYVHFQRITVMITPLSSIFDEFTDVKATILDRRFRRANEKQTLLLSSNENYVGDLSLDYSVPVISLDKILLCLNLEVPIMNNGEQWASCQMEVVVEESDYPLTIPFKEVLAVTKMPRTALEKYSHDPTKLDMTIHNIHRPRLMDMFMRKEIANELQPLEEKVSKNMYSKSTIDQGFSRKKKIGMVPTNDWEAVNRLKSNQIPLDQQSIDPEDADIDPADEDVSMPDSVDLRLRRAREMAEKNEEVELKGGEFHEKDVEVDTKLSAHDKHIPKLSRLSRSKVGFTSQ